MTLSLHPITMKEANVFIETHHRHHSPRSHFWKFGIAAKYEEKIVGVIVVGLPSARRLMDGYTLEVYRCCTDGTRNACSFLYSAAWRATKALGYRRLITYTLIEENGASLKAANWKLVGVTRGGTWSRINRYRSDNQPIGQKKLWEAV